MRSASTGRAETTFGGRAHRRSAAAPPAADSLPLPGRRRGAASRGRQRRRLSAGAGGIGSRRQPYASGGDDRVNVSALREITDDSGGRTEIVRTARDLDPATANIADELSQQYYIGYPAPDHKDGRWHTIRVDVNRPGLSVRARRGYTAGR